MTGALEVRGLSAGVDGKEILDGLDLVVFLGEVQDRMGPK